MKFNSMADRNQEEVLSFPDPFVEEIDFDEIERLEVSFRAKLHKFYGIS